MTNNGKAHTSTETRVANCEEVLVGQSEEIRKARALIERLAACDATVLICGETGTGKELAARAVHSLSARATKPMVCTNCSAIPDSLVESELFGAEKGAFTGATHRKNGQFSLANGGTLFLDEIGDMSMMAQAKILRAMESKEFRRLGAARTEHVDVRVVAATHRDLDKLVDSGQFRADLYFRLNVCSITMPPLRDRVSDIPLLTDRFIAALSAQYHQQIEGVTDGAMRVLQSYSWPGNIRELRNIIEGAFVLCTSGVITEKDLRLPLQRPAPALAVAGTGSYPLVSQATGEEPDQLLEALHATRWNKSEAAKRLRWSRMKIYRKMAKYKFPSREPAKEIPFYAQAS